MAKDFLGKGWAFPVQIDETGSIAMSEHEQDIKEAIRLILFTSPGERVMQPDFGCGIYDYVFASMSTTTIGLIESSIHEALTRFGARIDIVTLQVTLDRAEEGKLLIDLTYRVRSSNNEFNMVYPFYLREG